MSDYEYEGPPASTNEMSVVSDYMQQALPGAPMPEQSGDDSEWSDYFNEDDDAYEDEPQEYLDPVAALEQQKAEEFRAWEEDYRARHADAMAVRDAQIEQDGRATIDGFIDRAAGHERTPQATRDLIATTAEALYQQAGPHLRNAGFDDASIGPEVVRQAIQLVRDAETSAWALRRG
jgi:hypothetical protein